MRDKWRADEYLRDEAHHRERGRRARLERSPAASHRRQESDVGLKIRGTAKVDTAGRSGRDSEYRREDPGSVAAARKQSRSPRGRPRGEDSARFEKPLSPERPRYQDRRDHRGKFDSFHRSRISRSRSPVKESQQYGEERRQTRSPVFSAHTDQGISNRRLDRAFSPPPLTPRIDHYSSTHDESASRPLDSYVPGRRRRSRSPALRDEYRPAPPRPRPLTPVRRPTQRERSLLRPSERSQPRKRDRSRDSYIPRPERAQGAKSTNRRARSREAPPDRDTSVRLRRKRSPLPTQEEAKAEYNKRRRSRSSQRHARPKERKEMYPSGHPLQNAPQPQIAPMQQGYPMHDPSRRPPPLDTRHPYSASPQWTPVSSHQASPHSASPYSQGLPGWVGQQQQSQAQPG